jgi:hypothetical protein
VTTASPVDGGRIHCPDPSGIESGPATIFPDRLKDPDFRVEEKPTITPAAFPATRHHLVSWAFVENAKKNLKKFPGTASEGPVLSDPLTMIGLWGKQRW